MSEKEKQLLLKDLCARLPYGVKVSITAHNLDYEKDFGKTIIADLTGIHTSKDDEGTIHTCLITCYDKFKTQGNDIDTIKPYLRPMSSMTVEEKKEYNKTRDRIAVQWDDYGNPIGFEFVITFRTIDYLLQHHFDYRGLIWKGLALEAPEGMYKV